MIKIQPAKTHEISEVLELMKLVQPHLKRTEALLNWQYFQSPGGFTKLYLLRDQNTNQLISTYGAVSQFARADGKTAKTVMIQDVLTHPEHRGKGYLHTLAEHCLSEMKANSITGYTFPNELSHKSFFRTGWKRVFLIPNRERSLVGLQVKTDIDLSSKEMADAAEIGAELWKNLDVECGIERTKEFFKWRYSKPAEKYLLLAEKNRFFVVLKFFDSDEGRNMHLLDCLVSDQTQVSEILNAAIAFGVKSGATKMTAWLPETHPYARAFETAELKLKQRPERFFYTYSIESSDWHLTQGDSDVY